MTSEREINKSRSAQVLKCPYCSQPLERIPRRVLDHFADQITLGVFDLRRFKCYSCMSKMTLTKYTHRQS